MTLPPESFYPEKNLSPEWSIIKFTFDSEIPSEDEEIVDGDDQECSKTLRELIEENDLELCRKLCSRCKKSLPLNQFSKDAHLKSGHRSQCKRCVSEATNKEAAKARNIKWIKSGGRSKNVDKSRERNRRNSRTFREKHPERIAAAKRQWRIKNWAKRTVYRMKENSLKKGIPFSASPDDLFDKFTNKLPEFCPIFQHIRLDYGAGNDRRCWASVDKIVPELGYTSGNIWVVSMAANVWKNNGSNPAERERIVAIMKGRAKKKEPLFKQPSLFEEIETKEPHP